MPINGIGIGGSSSESYNCFLGWTYLAAPATSLTLDLELLEDLDNINTYVVDFFLLMDATQARTLALQVNGDTGNNYSYERILGIGGAASADSAAAQQRINVAQTAGAAPNDVLAGTLTIIQLPWGIGGSIAKIHGTCGTGTGYTAAVSGTWASAVKITHITLFETAGNMQAGSAFWVYGRKSPAP